MERPNRIHNRVAKKNFRTGLRKNLTPAEAAFWKMLKRSQIDGRKFRRQHSVGSYVLDFYCADERLAVELDGEGHFGPHAQVRDRARTRYLKEKGIKVLRFENELVFTEAAYVLDRIRAAFGWHRVESIMEEQTTPSAEAAATPP